MMDNIFFIYIYLDPRKPGDYNYGEYHFDHEPFYGGKGKGKQIDYHLNQAKRENSKDPNVFKIGKIRHMLEEGLEPIRYKIKENLLEQEALELEKLLIATIGRYDLGLGPLTNLTGGGEGVCGWIPSKQWREKKSDSLKGHIAWNKGKKCPQIGKAIKGRIPWNKGKKGIYSEESLELMRINHPDQSGENNPMFGKHHTVESNKKNSESHKGIPRSEESKRKQGITNTGKKRGPYKKVLKNVE